MREFNTLPALDSFSTDLSKNMDSILDATTQQVLGIDMWKNPEVDTFENVLGGWVYVLDTDDEVKDEIAGELFDEISAVNTYWVRCWKANNNAGGPTYYVPRDLFEKVTVDPDSNFVTKEMPYGPL